MLSPRILLGKCTMFSFLIRRLRGPEPIWHVFLVILISPTLEKKKKNHFVTVCVCMHAYVVYVEVRGQIGIVGAPLCVGLRHQTLTFSSLLARPLEDIKPCLGINELFSSFFSLLLEILLEGQASLPVVRVSEVFKFCNCCALGWSLVSASGYFLWLW